MGKKTETLHLGNATSANMTNFLGTSFIKNTFLGRFGLFSNSHNYLFYFPHAPVS
ncbi:hypothetical protein V6Z12_D09G070000 [Gossypium hirsutum]